ncbi:MAG: NAD-dependent epimerase/dehydratase family protein [Planctomycetota bacterium]
MTATDVDSMTRQTPAAPRGSRRTNAILITGAGGEVGHGLIRALHGAGREEVVAIDLRQLDPELRSLCCETYEGDVCDPMLLGRLLAMYEITEIYHLAALLSTRAEYTPETAHDVNVGGTINLLRLAAEQARSHGQRVKFIFPSSIAAYGLPSLEVKNQAGAVREDAFNTPHTMYGCNKLYGENLGRYYARFYRWLALDRVDDILDFRCVRYPGLISTETVPSGGTSDFAPEMIHAAAEGRPYTCFVRPDTRIPFMVMDDAIDETLKLANADKATLRQCVYNISAFNPSAGEFADLVTQFFPNADITFEPDTQRQAIVDSWPAELDCAAAERDWQFDATHDLESAFESYLVPRIRARYEG